MIWDKLHKLKNEVALYIVLEENNNGGILNFTL